jgi:hypothetical protein
VNQLGLEPRFRSLYHQSVPGSRINEDGFGLHQGHAWIVDGATGMSGDQVAPGSTDAAWLADIIGKRLQSLATDSRTADEVFGRLEAGIRIAFDDMTAQASVAGDDHTPSACLGVISVQHSAENAHLVLEGCFLADVFALVPSEDGVARWTDERAKPFEKRTLAALELGDRKPGRIPEAVRRQILENRTKLNHPEGYWVVNPRRPWAGRELRFQAKVMPGQPIVLATDGFMRLVDVFAVYSDASLHARLAAGEGDDLIKELRALERGDPMAGAYPRVKTHDDATVLVIAAETVG